MIGESSKEMLERHEGRRKFPYRCTSGKITIGIGRNLDDTGVSDEEIEKMFDNDIDKVLDDLEVIFGYSLGGDIEVVDNERYKALVDMRFQLGYNGFRSFKKMIAAIKEGDWGRVADEALDSKYAQKDTPERAKEIVEMLRFGE